MPKLWKPNEGGKYWSILLGLEGFEVMNDVFVSDSTWSVGPKDYKVGNCFRTKKEATKKIKQLQEILLDHE